MVDKVIVFQGSKKDFDEYIKKEIGEYEDVISFMELIQHYNARIRPSDSGVKERSLSSKLTADCCVVKADDYGSVLEHVLSNFVSIVCLNYDMEKLYVHNPPKRVLSSLISEYGEEIEYRTSDYEIIIRDKLKDIYAALCKDVLGQNECKKSIISNLYKLTASSNGKSVVLLLFGPSGVGKTETAKSISKALGGNLLRIQFSMMQTQEAYNYIFGAEHSKNSFARDLLGRDTNIVLIDEFDKVSSSFYNAFYELFDEGRYVDVNYDVDLKNTVFICTSNFMSEKEIRERLTPAMFSRIGACLEYVDLSSEQKKKIITNWYSEILDTLQEDEKPIIEGTNILKWFLDNADKYDNIRTLKLKLENAIFGELTRYFIIEGYCN